MSFIPSYLSVYYQDVLHHFLWKYTLSALIKAHSAEYWLNCHHGRRWDPTSRAYHSHKYTTISYSRGSNAFCIVGTLFWRKKTDKVFPMWEKFILLAKPNEPSYFKLYYNVNLIARTCVDTCRLTTSCVEYAPGYTYCITQAHVCTM